MIVFAPRKTLFNAELRGDLERKYNPQDGSLYHSWVILGTLDGDLLSRSVQGCERGSKLYRSLDT